MKYQYSAYFANGAGRLLQHENSDVLLIYRNGKNDGAARYTPHVKRYTRNGKEYKSRAELLRAVENEWEKTP